MVRTKSNDGGRKATGAKAPRKQVGASSESNMLSPSQAPGSGGNPIRWWPTPTWQKGVQSFFTKVDENSEDVEKGSTNSVPKSPSKLVSSSSSTCTAHEQPGVSTEELEIENLETDN